MTADNTRLQAGKENDRTVRIPVVEERLAAGKRQVDGRSVSVTTRPVTETVSIAEQLAQEDISVERVAVDRVVDQQPGVREEGDVTIIPVVEERLKVTIELVLREEIHVRRTRSTVTETREVELSRTEVDIDQSEQNRS